VVGVFGPIGGTGLAKYLPPFFKSFYARGRVMAESAACSMSSFGVFFGKLASEYALSLLFFVFLFSLNLRRFDYKRDRLCLAFAQVW